MIAKFGKNFAGFIIIFIFAALFFSSASSTNDGQTQSSKNEEAPSRLSINSIPQVMEKVFQEHVSQKKMTPQIMKRAIENYIDQFDPERAYLLAPEVNPYLSLPSVGLKRLVDQYYNDDFSFFEKISQLFQRAIIRARKTRQDMMQRKVMSLSKKTENSARNTHRSFVKTIQELKVRQANFFASKINQQEVEMKSLKKKSSDEEIRKDADQEIREQENGYLYLDRQGRPLGKEQKNELFAFHLLKALTSSLDAHTAFFNPQEAEDLKINLEKAVEGVGITLTEEGKTYVVSEIMPNSPASNSGKIQVGDELVAVDHQKVSMMNLNQVQAQLQGKVGTQITLDFQRTNATGEPTSQKYSVTLKRQEIAVNEGRVDTNFVRVPGGIIGIISLHSFYQGDHSLSSEKDVRKALDELSSDGQIRGLIVDLRDNRGGFLMQAVKVAGLFLKSGVIVSSRYSNGSVHYFRDLDPNVYYSGPLVILTSRLTASAAEIVTQALKDYGVALVVGDDQTYGKGSIQMQTVTNNTNDADSYFKVTVGRYYGVSGESTQIGGVKADIIVPSIYFNTKLGEEYLENTLSQDKMPPAFHDTLQDINEKDKAWYLKHYVPFIQKRETKWRKLLPELKQKSQQRLENDPKYQELLSELSQMKDDPNAGSKKQKIQNDLWSMQLEEAINIVKDMIDLSKSPKSNLKSNAIPELSPASSSPK